MIPKISIIIPVYNAEQYLHECLDSILTQSFTEFEVILVNDGSEDNSGTICQEYVNRDSRFHYIFQSNKGVCTARNVGLDSAVSNSIVFMDADDWLAKDGLKKLYDEYIRTSADLIVADVFFVDGDKRNIVRIFNEPFTTTDPQFIISYERACIGYGYNPKPGTRSKSAGLGSLWNKLFNRKIIEDNHIRFDTYVLGIYEDNLFVLNYLERCKSFSYISEVVYNYRKVGNSNSRGFKSNTLDINKRIFERIISFIDQFRQENADDFMKAFYMYVIRRLEVSLTVYFFARENNKSFLRKLKELHKLIRSEPYDTAIKKVEYKLLKPNNKLTWLSARTYSALVIWIGMNVGHLASGIRKYLQ